jgi:hypothetical protein
MSGSRRHFSSHKLTAPLHSDAVAKPATELIRDTIVRNRESDGPSVQGQSEESSKSKKSKQEKKQTKKQETKQGSSSVTIITENVAPPNPEDVVLADGEVIVIPLNRSFDAVNATYEQKVEFLKPVMKRIIGESFCLISVASLTNTCYRPGSTTNKVEKYVLGPIAPFARRGRMVSCELSCKRPDAR